MNIFDCACHIIASKNCDLDQAMEDAIHINAQDVEEMKEDDQIYFKVTEDQFFYSSIPCCITSSSLFVAVQVRFSVLPKEYKSVSKSRLLCNFGKRRMYT